MYAFEAQFYVLFTHAVLLENNENAGSPSQAARLALLFSTVHSPTLQALRAFH
jgi:hypothetical protein